MFSINNLSLYQFRNYTNHSFTFKSPITGIVGNNGTGKTNLLDAVYYLSFTKSYFSRPEALNVTHGLSGMRLEGCYEMDNEPFRIAAVTRENGRRELSVNGLAYQRQSKHIGRFPCVMIAPDDIELITGGGEARRRYMDAILSQIDATYLQELLDYNRFLLQRNTLLKGYAETGRLDNILLDIYTRQLCDLGDILYAKRANELSTLLEQVLSNYSIIANQSDDISLSYQSQMHKMPMWDCVAKDQQKDFLLQRTNSGIHKDDLIINMGTNVFKTVASQGQRKSLLFALKLAEWQTIQKAKATSPILLLDDVFEKLDNGRMQNLLSIVCSKGRGQVLISDTDKNRVERQLKEVNTAFQIMEM